jgi:First C2 domain of RPGR-interacting protein 1
MHVLLLPDTRYYQHLHYKRYCCIATAVHTTTTLLYTRIQVWVVGCALREGCIAPGASSFVVIDFYDYESQATTLLTGSSPKFDFATTYKVTVDDLFLK